LQAGPGRVRNEIYAEMLDGHIVVKASAFVSGMLSVSGVLASTRTIGRCRLREVTAEKGTSFALEERLHWLRVAETGRTAEGAGRVYSARSPWKEEAGRPAIVLQAEEVHKLHLAQLDILLTESAHR
jgi:hypothetical protein